MLRIEYGTMLLTRLLPLETLTIVFIVYNVWTKIIRYCRSAANWMYSGLIQIQACIFESTSNNSFAKIMKRTTLTILLFASTTAFASDSFTIFTKHELNDTDSISGIGFSGIMGSHNSNFKSEVITSLNSITVIDEFGYQQEYFGLDLGIRFGYFSDIFMYFEGGFDVFEAFYKHENNDPIFNSHYTYDTYDANNLDGYVALGAGIQAGNLRIEGFVKARQIDAEYWNANKTLFYGMQFSLSF